MRLLVTKQKTSCKLMLERAISNSEQREENLLEAHRLAQEAKEEIKEMRENFAGAEEVEAQWEKLQENFDSLGKKVDELEEDLKSAALPKTRQLCRKRAAGFESGPRPATRPKIEPEGSDFEPDFEPHEVRANFIIIAE